MSPGKEHDVEGSKAPCTNQIMPYNEKARYHASAEVGEPLNQFIQRVRLERAAAKLIDQPRLTITEIALECGFSGSSTFARSFAVY
jgi:AraC-like DNA-binding protein